MTGLLTSNLPSVNGVFALSHSSKDHGGPDGMEPDGIIEVWSPPDVYFWFVICMSDRLGCIVLYFRATGPKLQTILMTWTWRRVFSGGYMHMVLKSPLPFSKGRLFLALKVRTSIHSMLNLIVFWVKWCSTIFRDLPNNGDTFLISTDHSNPSPFWGHFIAFMFKMWDAF